jgi:hypothetical protein
MGGDRVQIQGHVRHFTVRFSMFLPFGCRLFGGSLTCSVAIQYPYGQDEDDRYYSGYDDKVRGGVSYTGYWSVNILDLSTICS